MEHSYADAKKTYLKVLGALLMLTALTVYVASFDFGEMNIFVALFIAACKGSLVALFFMHLKDDRPIDGIIFATALFMLALFLSLTLIDENSRIIPRPADLRPPRGGPGTSTLVNAEGAPAPNVFDPTAKPAKPSEAPAAPATTPAATAGAAEPGGAAPASTGKTPATPAAGHAANPLPAGGH